MFRLLGYYAVLCAYIASYAQAWEEWLPGTKPSLFSWKDGEFQADRCSLAEPTTWEPVFHDCERDEETNLCKTNRRRLRGEGRKLQSEPYIKLLFQEGLNLDAATVSVFQDAADTWNNVIIANTLVPFSFRFAGFDTDATNVEAAGACGLPGSFIIDFIDVSEPSNLYILIVVDEIDGEGGTLAQAATCISSDDVNGNENAYFGFMRFDEVDFAADVANNLARLQDIVLHEMGHVIGIGGGWLREGFVTNPVGPGQESNLPEYNAANGIEGFNDLGGSGVLRVENDFGPGSQNVHWDEAIFRNELMSPQIGSAGNPLSIMTVKSLLDFGLVVDLCAAEDFAGFSASSLPECQTAGAEDPTQDSAQDSTQEPTTVDENADSSRGAAVIGALGVGGVLLALGTVLVVRARRTRNVSTMAQTKMSESPVEYVQSQAYGQPEVSNPMYRK